jgi:hypothetical protein
VRPAAAHLAVLVGVCDHSTDGQQCRVHGQDAEVVHRHLADGVGSGERVTGGPWNCKGSFRRGCLSVAKDTLQNGLWGAAGVEAGVSSSPSQPPAGKNRLLCWTEDEEAVCAVLCKHMCVALFPACTGQHSHPLPSCHRGAAVLRRMWQERGKPENMTAPNISLPLPYSYTNTLP